MKRAARAAWWLLPALVCLALYWFSLKTWFFGDDFAWLGLGQEVVDWRSFLQAVFEPRAQGTFRPLSERLFFLAFYQAFGMEAVPFHIWIFLTQFASLALVASITRRISGSAGAGMLAALLWLGNNAMVLALGWTCVYNQVMCGLFLLLAFHFLLRFIETGLRRYEIAQWAVFLLGFGVMETNVVYPVLAGGYTALCARKYFRRTLPLVAPSLAFAGWRLLAVSGSPDPVYSMHFDSRIFSTLLTYWTWTAGPSWLRLPYALDRTVLFAAVALVSAAVLGFVAWQALRRRWLPSFCLLWFLAAVAPVLPLPLHLTEYYTYLPGIGAAMLGGVALAWAWRCAAGWRIAAAVIAVLYLAMTVPTARNSSEWLYRRGKRVERLVRSVAAAHELHPYQIILLEGLSDDLFWTAVLDRPFRLYGARVYLTPGTEERIKAQPGYGDPAEYVLPAQATERALDHGSVVVYAMAGDRLRAMTTVYGRLLRDRGPFPTPRRLDAGNPLLAYLMGPEWSEDGVEWRWMPRRATLRLGGPATPKDRLYLRGTCAAGLTAAGPVRVSVTADGMPLAPTAIPQGQSEFDLSFALPPEIAGRPEVQFAIEAGHTVRTAEDDRRFSLAFGVMEIR